MLIVVKFVAFLHCNLADACSYLQDPTAEVQPAPFDMCVSEYKKSALMLLLFNFAVGPSLHYP